MDFKEPQAHEQKIKGLYRFFCWCSGARLYLLKKCPTDYNIFFGIGMIVFLTGVMASLSGSYAFYTIFNNVYLAAGFGLFWGILIFFFDWYLVASLKKEGRFFKELAAASPRLILALFLAMVISRPLELKLFASEIEAHMAKTSQEDVKAYKDVVNASFAEIQELQLQNKQYQNKLDELLLQRTELFNLIVEEAEGRSPTGASGKGPVYKEKKDQFDRITQLYEDERTRLTPLILNNQERIASLQSNRDAEMHQGAETVKAASGFLSRIEAYQALTKENQGIRFTGLFILLLFVCIETGPLFVKLISRKGAYDELLALNELQVMAASQEEQERIREKTKRLIVIEQQKGIMRLEDELENNRLFTKQVLEAQAEIGAERIKRWKARELARVDDDLNDYRPTIDELVDEARLTMKPN